MYLNIYKNNELIIGVFSKLEYLTLYRSFWLSVESLKVLL